MTLQVLYRKWRPGSFQEVAGQEPVTQTLRHALEQERVAHAYLFCGPRGTGKTSTARILAKAVNCQALRDGEPCNTCPFCQAVSEGRALDLIEIDAASNRGIDDMRTLRERVHYAPSEGRYKVYIIDEVHMLTEAAFNALLKTLEEPPPHTILVLATTEPHKVPATIISRCQRFDFRRISTDAMVRRLQELCAGESLEAGEEVLSAVARQAGGSLRDATNLLEQLAISYGSTLTREHLRDLLGLGDEESALELVDALFQGKTREGLLLINQVAAQGLDLRQFHRAVVECLRMALLLKSNAAGLVEQPAEVVQRLKALATGTPLQRILRALQLFGQTSVHLDTASPLPLELALAEATLDTSGTDVSSPAVGEAVSPPVGSLAPGTPSSLSAEAEVKAQAEIAPPERVEPVAVPAMPAATGLSGARPSASVSAEATEAPVEPVPSAGGLEAQVAARWEEIVKVLSRRKGKRYFIGALMRDSRSRRVEGQAIVLTFVSKANMGRLQEEVDSPEGRRVIREVLTSILGSSPELRLELEGNRGEPGNGGEGGHLVRAAQRMGARIVDEGGEKP